MTNRNGGGGGGGEEKSLFVIPQSKENVQHTAHSADTRCINISHYQLPSNLMLPSMCTL